MGTGRRACSYFLLLLPLILQGLKAASVSSSLIEQQITSTATSSCISDNMSRHEQDGEEAREIAQYLPYFPFKGVFRDALIECLIGTEDIF